VVAEGAICLSHRGGQGFRIPSAPPLDLVLWPGQKLFSWAATGNGGTATTSRSPSSSTSTAQPRTRS